jgi:hypothetical protein
MELKRYRCRTFAGFRAGLLARVPDNSGVGYMFS